MTTKTRATKKTSKKSDPLDTPMMRQYLEVKKNHPDSILFFRMGDFYEMFLEDAEQAAPLMDVALTRRQNQIPMAGIPFHSVDTYVARLIGAGKKVAIAEQEADPENPKLMRRAVRRIITPGTLVEDSLLQSGSFNFLMAVVRDGVSLGMALADISTGDFFSLEIAAPEEDENNALDAMFRDYFARFSPREILVPSDEIKIYRELIPEAAQSITPMEDWKASPTEGVRRINERFGANLKGLGYDRKDMASLGAVSLILHYITSNFPTQELDLNPPVFRKTEGRFMQLDEQTIRNLDLVYNYQEGGQTRTLYSILNNCRTPVGKRQLKDILLNPLLDKKEINQRLDLVGYLKENEGYNSRLSDAMSGIFDMERVLGRLTSGRGAPRDFTALRDTVNQCESILELVTEFPKAAKKFQKLIKLSPELLKLRDELKKRIVEDPPAILGGGRLFKKGLNKELDRAHDAKESGSKWILEFEKEEREKTGIPTLKVRYNKIVGYFIEISKTQASKAPAEYQRKQTLVTGERFTCDRLVELERTISQADEVISRLETGIFQDFSEKLLSKRRDIKDMMSGIAYLDFVSSLASVAARHGWSRPHAVESGELIIESGRHPVVEKYLPPGEAFIANDVKLDADKRSFAVLTGPNMAGKSTYIRQIALIQLLMQIGSFVPARHATLSIVDRIFTRIGASDNLTRGESTFFVEMLETARILNQSTENSLVIMDEVGRGTSTYDGLSIAWAVVEYFTGEEEAKPRVLFATHYHELTAMESRAGVFNLTMDVQEAQGKVMFMRKVREGPADRSYGIHVAQLAGLPPEVTARAEEKLAELEAEYQEQKAKPAAPKTGKRKKTAEKKEAAQQEQGFLF